MSFHSNAWGFVYLDIWAPFKHLVLSVFWNLCKWFKPSLLSPLTFFFSGLPARSSQVAEQRCRSLLLTAEWHPVTCHCHILHTILSEGHQAGSELHYHNRCFLVHLSWGRDSLRPFIHQGRAHEGRWTLSAKGSLIPLCTAHSSHQQGLGASLPHLLTSTWYDSNFLIFTHARGKMVPYFNLFKEVQLLFGELLALQGATSMKGPFIASSLFSTRSLCFSYGLAVICISCVLNLCRL